MNGQPLPTRHPFGTSAALQFALIVLFALAARWNALGDPNYQIDETFYLVVGKAMHQGAMPYLDIWDRKPPGLFAIYWLAASFANPVLAYQLLALLSVILTAWLLRGIGATLAGQQAGLLTGLAYAAMLQPLLGGGGQSPVFYNLLIAAAAALFARATSEVDRARLRRSALLAAFAGGLAVAIKPTALFEGAFICLAFAWQARRMGMESAKLARLLLAMALAGAAPMLTAFAWYALEGQFSAIWQATVMSIFARKAEDLPNQVHILRYTLTELAPLLLLAALGAWLGGKPPLARFVRGWTLAAVAGFVAVPGFYLHYALPLAAPLAVLAAPAFALRLAGPLAALGLVSLALLHGGSFDLARKGGSVRSMSEASAAVRANLGHGPLYVYSGPPLLYLSSGSHRPTRFLFPEHLSIRDEMAATGVDTRLEVSAILARQPRVIVLRARPFRAPNPLTCPLVRAALARNYHLVRKVAMTEYAGRYDLLIFALSVAEPSQPNAALQWVCVSL